MSFSETERLGEDINVLLILFLKTFIKKFKILLLWFYNAYYKIYIRAIFANTFDDDSLSDPKPLTH